MNVMYALEVQRIMYLILILIAKVNASELLKLMLVDHVQVVIQI